MYARFHAVQNGAKNLPDGAAHTYIAYIREYPPPGTGQKRSGTLFRSPTTFFFCPTKIVTQFLKGGFSNSYSLIFFTINTFKYSRSSLENHTDSRPKPGQNVCPFSCSPKRRKKPTRWGGTYLYSLYKGVPPSRHRAEA